MKTIVETSEGERIGAEREFAAQIGVSCSFGWGDVEHGESEPERVADELLDKMAGQGMAPRLALSVATLLITERAHVRTVEDSTVVEVIKCILERILRAAHPRREADCLRMAFGFRETNAESMREKARHYGVTVEAISKDVAELRRVFALGINSFNKSAKAAKAYAFTNRLRTKP